MIPTKDNIFQNSPKGGMEYVGMAQLVFDRHNAKCFTPINNGYLNKVKYEKQDEYKYYDYKYTCLGCGDKGLT